MQEKEKLKGKIAIIGVGEHPSGIFQEKTAAELFYFAVKEAIKDAGISKDDIDAIIVEPCFADRWFNTDLIWSRAVQELGLGGRCKTNVQVHSGGSTGSQSLRMALGLILSGQAETILVAHVDKLGSGLSAEEIRVIFSSVGIYEEWEAPYGLNYNAIGALITNRYMYETGTTIEEIASVIVSLRKWAVLNPNALLRRELTIEEVLKSKMIAYPLTSRMCNIVCDGAHAYIVTSAKKAEKAKTPVYLLGMGGIVTHFSLMKADITKFGWKKAAEEAFTQAGIKPEDVDIVELYDSYPVMPLIQLEELGFCERGKAGKFVYEGNTWPGGKLPMTTDGGSLARGHHGAGCGIAHIVEAARQLMGKAGKRQVKNAKIGIATNIGGQYMDAQVMVFGREMP
jgi:acetyl-CoA C-acetyltransferase